MQPVPAEEPEYSPKPKKKRSPWIVVHADNRHGYGWPREPRSGAGNKWTGWLTHQEYNLIEFHNRFELDDMYAVGQYMNLNRNSAEHMFHRLRKAGIIDGEVACFTITDMAKILFDMTDQYILELDLGDG